MRVKEMVADPISKSLLTPFSHPFFLKEMVADPISHHFTLIEN